MRAERHGANQFNLTAQWPRRHFFYRVEDGTVDPILVAETLRQATIFVAHQYYDVPLARKFLMNRMQICLKELSIPATIRPPEITIGVSVDHVKSGVHGASRLQTNVEFTWQDMVIGEGVGELQVVDARVYARMRSGSHEPEWLNPPAGVHLDGELRAQGVALRRVGTAPAWHLELDHTHPVFFDHPVDHVPGMLVMEAARQAVGQVVGTDMELTDFDGRYFRFLDLDHTTLMRLQHWSPDTSGGGEGRFTLNQHDIGAVDVQVRAKSRRARQ